MFFKARSSCLQKNPFTLKFYVVYKKKADALGRYFHRLCHELSVTVCVLVQLKGMGQCLGEGGRVRTLVAVLFSQGDFTAIVDLPEGDHEYKFYVDGEWLHNPDEVCLV